MRESLRALWWREHVHHIHSKVNSQKSNEIKAHFHRATYKSSDSTVRYSGARKAEKMVEMESRLPLSPVLPPLSLETISIGPHARCTTKTFMILGSLDTTLGRTIKKTPREVYTRGVEAWYVKIT